MQQHKKQDATVRIVKLSTKKTVLVKADNYNGASIIYRTDAAVAPRVGDTITFTVEWNSP